MRVGILGGTFDPVHKGHLALSQAAREELSLAEVLFVPAGQPWRKAGREIAEAEHRLAMLRLALEGEPTFRVWTVELERSGPSYTADTLEELRAERPDDELYFIVGEDAMYDMENWVRPQRILELATLVIARREPPPIAEPLRSDDQPGRRRSVRLEVRPVEFHQYRTPRGLVWLDMPLVKVSATEVRWRVREGEPIDDLVPPAVATYIREHALYRT